MKKILVTGGAGYIGSHVCKALRDAGYEPITFDNLSNGNAWAVRFGPFFRGDLQNKRDLDQVFTKYRPDAVIHLAASIDLRESLENPHSHYANNVGGTLCLLKSMIDHQVFSLVFSSSAAVYAPPAYLPMDEDHPKGATSPYGNTKWMCEQMIHDFYASYGLAGVCLRYFNAAGADAEANIGEAHRPETHLIPRLLMTAQKKQPYFTLYGSDFPTPDGTAIRDYIHVTDLAQAHIKALEWLNVHQRSEAFNLGTGQGFSVLQMIQKVEEVIGYPLEIKYENRRLGESAILVADARKAQAELDWIPVHSDLDSIVATAWKWHNLETSLILV